MARPTGTDGTAVLDRPMEDGSSTSADMTGSVASNGTDGGTAAKRQRRNPDELPDSEIISLNVRFPNALRKQVATTAAEQQTSVPQLIVSMVAEAYGYELPKSTRTTRTKKYANKEERIAAQKAKQQRDRQVSRAILQAVEEGKLDLDIEGLLADLRSKANAEDAATAAS